MVHGGNVMMSRLGGQLSGALFSTDGILLLRCWLVPTCKCPTRLIRLSDREYFIALS